MNRRRADLVVGLLVAAVLVFGGLLSLQVYRQNQALDGMMGSMMGTSSGMVHGTNPLWYVLGTILVSAVVVGLYFAVRDDLTSPAGDGWIQREVGDAAGYAIPEGTEAPAVDSRPSEARNPEEQPTRRVLDLLPDDERRVLEPVITSPGITQIELRDRSDFSKSKVSQTVSELEKRGLLYRERQGRTYRVYPSEELRQGRQQ